MTEKYRVHDLAKFHYSEIGEYIDENHTDRPLRNDILVDLLNQLNDENEQLKQSNLQLARVNREGVEKVQKLAEENEQLKFQLQNTCDQRDEFHRGARENANYVGKLEKENEQLKRNNNELIEKIKKLEKEIHLIHMSSMFSTVKSFKGDVSKRYTYNEKTDTIYDTANNYGQYHKILDKKEITMLLNEYETVLNEEEQE